MTFEQEFMHGYKQHGKNFDKWCDKAYSTLGDVTQCGVAECDNSGHALIATHRPTIAEDYLDNKGYMFDTFFSFDNNLKDKFVLSVGRKEYDPSHPSNLFDIFKKARINFGISYVEKIDAATQRVYWICSDTPKFYNVVLNNMSLVKKFIKHFKQENEQVIDYYRDRKFYLAEKKENYFINDSDYTCCSEKEKSVKMLRTLGILEYNQNITDREWQCLQMYCQGRTASKTGSILGISRRTVEAHFDNLKNKLKVNSKSELINTLSEF